MFDTTIVKRVREFVRGLTTRTKDRPIRRFLALPLQAVGAALFVCLVIVVCLVELLTGEDPDYGSRF